MTAADVNPSERELDILKVLWSLGESKVRDVHRVLNAQRKTAITTVQTLLRIMADKGLVHQRAEGRTLYYSPIHTIEQVSSRFLQRVFDGSLVAVARQEAVFFKITILGIVC